MSQNLLEGENLVSELHRHWIVLARGLALPVALVMLALLADLVIGSAMPRDVRLLLPLAVASVAGLWLIVVWVRWNATSVTMTDQRIILASGVFGRQTKVIPLDRVQDVTTRQNLAGRMIGYGTVEIDAAGASGAEVIDHMPGPTRLRDEVFVQTGRLRGGQPHPGC
jgi:uncharacterized membrane protein YdbT with pleckstrin-like domain